MTIDLRDDLLPYVTLDYLTLLCRTPLHQQEIINQLKKLKPNLTVCDLDDKSENNLNKKEIKYGEFRDEKYAEISSKNDVIYQRIPYRSENALFNHQLKLPGPFAHEVFLAVLNGSVDITLCEITRFDLNLRPPGFVLGDYDEKRNQLLELHEFRKDSELHDNVRQNYAILKLGSRKSARFERTYINKKQDKITFEIEIKRAIAKSLHPLLLTKDLLEINKLFLFEILSCFKRLNYCSYTKVLIDWSRQELLPLKHYWFSENSLVRRPKGQKEMKPTGLVPCKLSDLVNPSLNVLNYAITEVIDVNKKDNALLIMILIYCCKMLFERWNKEKNHETIEFQIHKLNWNPNPNPDYSIEFNVSDLLEFLNMANNTNTRKHVTKLLTSLFKENFVFEVNSVCYLEHLVQFLAIKKQQGKETVVRLELHPFVLYNLLDQGILYKNKFHSEFKRFFFDKKISSSFFRVFLNLLAALSTKNELFLKNAIMCRNRNNKEYRQKHLELVYNGLELFKKFYKVEVGLELNGIKKIPVTLEFLGEVILPYSNKPLEKAKFHYHVLDFSNHVLT